jgi:hypothetical protein
MYDKETPVIEWLAGENSAGVGKNEELLADRTRLPMTDLTDEGPIVDLRPPVLAAGDMFYQEPMFR